jgi:EAL domain-containing protein (putative c-di-GMP-specific phosphodiesterase class I)
VTESALGGDPDRAERCVLQLRARGLRVSIDDFGVGYSSMSQLLGLAIDELKIDKSFTLRLTSDPRAQAIVRSTIELARALSLTLVAEGIETEEVLHSLQKPRRRHRAGLPDLTSAHVRPTGRVPGPP